MKLKNVTFSVTCPRVATGLAPHYPQAAEPRSSLRPVTESLEISAMARDALTNWSSMPLFTTVSCRTINRPSVVTSARPSFFQIETHTFGIAFLDHLDEGFEALVLLEGQLTFQFDHQGISVTPRRLAQLGRLRCICRHARVLPCTGAARSAPQRRYLSHARELETEKYPICLQFYTISSLFS